MVNIMEFKDWIEETKNSSKLGNIVKLSNEEFDKIMGPEIEKAMYRFLHPTKKQIKEYKKNFDVSYEWDVIIDK